MPHQETRPFGGKLAACTSSNFWSFSSARSTPHAFACSRPGANRNLRDSRSPSYASWERRAPGNTSPAVDCPPILPGMGGLPGRSNLPVGRAPHTSSQADDLQLFIIGAQPARNRRTRTQVPRHHRRRGGVGNLRIVQLFLHCPSCEPGSLKGGLDFSGAGRNDPQGGFARLLPVNATLPGSGEPPSVWNDDDSTQTARSWHGSVIRVAEGPPNYGRAVWVWATLCGGTGFTLPPFTAGFRALASSAHGTTSSKDRPTRGRRISHAVTEQPTQATG